MLGEGITLADTLEAPDNTEETQDCFRLVRAARDCVAVLPAPQDELIRLHDLPGHGPSEAGCLCGLSPSAANSAYQKARETLYHNVNLRALAEAHRLDQRTHWYRQVGIREYRSTWMSSTEVLAFWREAERGKAERLNAQLPKPV